MLSKEFSSPMQIILHNLQITAQNQPYNDFSECHSLYGQSSSFSLAIMHAHYICNMKYHGISLKLVNLTKANLHIRSFMSCQPLELIYFVAKYLLNPHLSPGTQVEVSGKVTHWTTLYQQPGILTFKQLYFLNTLLESQSEKAVWWSRSITPVSPHRSPSESELPSVLQHPRSFALQWYWLCPVLVYKDC